MLLLYHGEAQSLKPVIVPPVGVVCIAADQVYVVPVTVEFNAMLLAVSSQMV